MSYAAMVKERDAVLLERWALVVHVSRDGSRKVCLHGVSQGHPRVNDGHRLLSTEIVSADGRLVTTRTGTRYELLLPHPEWRAHLRLKGTPYLAHEPASPRQQSAAVTEEEAHSWPRT